MHPRGTAALAQSPPCTCSNFVFPARPSCLSRFFVSHFGSHGPSPTPGPAACLCSLVVWVLLRCTLQHAVEDNHGGDDWWEIVLLNKILGSTPTPSFLVQPLPPNAPLFLASVVVSTLRTTQSWETLCVKHCRRRHGQRIGAEGERAEG